MNSLHQGAVDGHVDDFRQLFLRATPMLDVRAPVEFERGAFPNSINIPLLDDAQRERIGIIYKQSGQAAAVAAGEEMATPAIRARRIAAWREFATDNPGAVLYCFRGGLRSRITRRWLLEAGVDMPLVEGGYKALRQFLLQQLETLPNALPLVVISGRTGVGKTELLHRLPWALDLERLAGHRGSSFGALADAAQPTVINFENAIAVQLLQHAAGRPGLPLPLEDEGRLIGRLRLPRALEQAMAEAPLLQLECPFAERVGRIRRDYIEARWDYLRRADEAGAASRFEEHVFGNLGRIRRRLGGVRYRRIEDSWRRAAQHFFASGDATQFDEGIGLLLRDYYDPMYDYQLGQREVDVLQRGDATSLLGYLQRQMAAASSVAGAHQ